MRSNEIKVILTAAMPIIELKGAIPVNTSFGMAPFYIINPELRFVDENHVDKL